MKRAFVWTMLMTVCTVPWLLILALLTNLR